MCTTELCARAITNLNNGLDLLGDVEVELEHLVEDEAPLLKIKQLVRHSGCVDKGI